MGALDCIVEFATVCMPCDQQRSSKLVSGWRTVLAEEMSALMVGLLAYLLIRPLTQAERHPGGACAARASELAARALRMAKANIASFSLNKGNC